LLLLPGAGAAYGAAYGEGDVLGFLINLPSDAPFAADFRKNDKPVEYKGRVLVATPRTQAKHKKKLKRRKYFFFEKSVKARWNLACTGYFLR
jgi:hypothetical protein